MKLKSAVDVQWQLYSNFQRHERSGCGGGDWCIRCRGPGAASQVDLEIQTRSQRSSQCWPDGFVEGTYTNANKVLSLSHHLDVLEMIFCKFSQCADEKLLLWICALPWHTTHSEQPIRKRKKRRNHRAEISASCSHINPVFCFPDSLQWVRRVTWERCRWRNTSGSSSCSRSSTSSLTTW